MELDLSSLRVLFVCVASDVVGFGHLSRCLILGKYAKECGAEICFLLFGSLDAKERVNAAGFDCISFEKSSIKTSEWEYSIKKQSDLVIIDIVFPSFIGTEDKNSAAVFLFSRFRSFGSYLVAIDVLGHTSIVSHLRTIDVDLILNPYVCPAIDLKQMPWNYIQGPEYVPLGVEYVNLPTRKQRNSANRVLVSCGGGDSKRYTLEVLSALEIVDVRLEIKVIVGPFFSADFHIEIEGFAAESRHKIEMVIRPQTLLNAMLWCDIAIGTNGLTKYELAASATPAILFSIDEDHEEANRPFAKMQTSINLGIGVNIDQLCYEAFVLLTNFELRRSMANQGRSLVDGVGAERTFKEIKKEMLK